MSVKNGVGRVHRREFLQRSLGLCAGVAASSSAIQVGLGESRLPLAIRNGTVFLDGELREVDIGVTRLGRIRLGHGLSAEESINARGCIVAPGFIDVLADGITSTRSAYKIFEKYKLTDGVTTALQMHGGAAEIEGYYNRHLTVPHWVNYGVSTKVMLIRNKYASVEERRSQVERCLDEGALGVSHSVEYQPTPWDEMTEYAQLAKKYDRPLFLHLRYSSAERELDGVDEAIRLAEVTGSRIHLDHLHSTGGTFHMEEALRKVRVAVQRGLRLTVGVYPYSFWATYLNSRRFSPGWQERYGLTYDDLQVVGTGEHLTQESFDSYRAMRGVLVAVPPGTMPPEQTINLALREDFCLIGSDGGILSEPQANNHPRGAGCFATAIGHCLSIGLGMEEALKKVTLLPRQVIGEPLRSRGTLQEGAWADVTIFEPDSIEGKATVSDPNQFSRGIRTVLVNGQVAYRDGDLKLRSGHPIRAKETESASGVPPQAGR